MRSALVAMVLLAGCATPQNSTPSGPVIRVAGSETLTTRLVPLLGAAWSRAHPGSRVEVSPMGSGPGIRALLEGKADIAVSSRDILPAEEEQARANGYSLTDPGSRHLLGVDVVAVVVHPSNPLDSLTYDQIIGIFCNRTIDNWSYLGMQDLPIVPAAREAGSGTHDLFEDFFCGPKGIHPRVPPRTLAEAGELIRTEPGAISFVSLTEVGGKIIGLRPDAYGHAMLPSQQNILRGAYPLYHDVWMFTPGPPKEEVGDFLAWIATPAGQEIVDEARFVPLFLRPERLDAPRPLRETVHFEAGSRAPSQRSLARMRLLVDELRTRAGGERRHITLEGFCDDREPDALTLSRQRAEAVRDLLQDQLPGIYFEIIPRGADRPIAPNTTPYGRQRNRRVQIYLADEEREADVLVAPHSPPSPPSE